MDGGQFSGGRRGLGLGIVIGVLVALAVVGVAAAAFVLGRSSSTGDEAEDPIADVYRDAIDDGRSTTTTSKTTASAPPTTAAPTGAPTATPTTAAAATTASPTTSAVPRPSVVGDVLDQPSGLLCRDLEARGFSYRAAMEYWYGDGQPARMDEDLNGIPCETVYPDREIDGYWGDIDLDRDDVLPSGLLCRDLEARGHSYAEAVDYWFGEGLPDRMDADGNGIPCETVYPSAEVDAFWDP